MRVVRVNHGCDRQAAGGGITEMGRGSIVSLHIPIYRGSRYLARYLSTLLPHGHIKHPPLNLLVQLNYYGMHGRQNLAEGRAADARLMVHEPLNARHTRPKYSPFLKPPFLTAQTDHACKAPRLPDGMRDAQRQELRVDGRPGKVVIERLLGRLVELWAEQLSVRRRRQQSAIATENGRDEGVIRLGGCKDTSAAEAVGAPEQHIERRRVRGGCFTLLVERAHVRHPALHGWLRLGIKQNIVLDAQRSPDVQPYEFLKAHARRNLNRLPRLVVVPAIRDASPRGKHKRQR